MADDNQPQSTGETNAKSVEKSPFTAFFSRLKRLLVLLFWPPRILYQPPSLAASMVYTLRWLLGGVLSINVFTRLLWVESPGVAGLNVFVGLLNGAFFLAASFLMWSQLRLIRKSQEIRVEKAKDAAKNNLKTADSSVAQPAVESVVQDEAKMPQEGNKEQTPDKKEEPKYLDPNPSFIETITRWFVWIFACMISILSLSDLILRALDENVDNLNILVVTLIYVTVIFALDLAYQLATDYKEVFEIKKDAGDNDPRTQQRKKSNRWEWIGQLPLADVKDQKKRFPIVEKEKEEKIIKAFEEKYKSSPAQAKLAIERLRRDIGFLEENIGDIFRQRDYEAKYYQTAYRRYQIAYMLLAALAGIFGSLLGLSFNQNNYAVALFGFCETVVALITTYLATISGRESPLQEWLTNRQKAEGLRREYQRYLVNLEPYDTQSPIIRQRLLKMRAAAINLMGSPDIDDEKITETLRNSDPAEQTDTN